MNLLTIIGIALGLSMDAFSVSVANGCIIKELKFHHALRIAFFFGFFQAAMPLLGWVTGSLFSSYIQAVDHWIAFGLLSFIGIKMIYESRNLEKECHESPNCNHTGECRESEDSNGSIDSNGSENSTGPGKGQKKDCRHYPTLLILSIATSIDALAVGISFAFLNIQIIFPVILIGIITFIVCFGGIFIGNKIGSLFENKLEFAGGLILIGIGSKILIEHLFF